MTPIGFYRPDLANTNPGVSGTVLNAILSKDALGVAYGPHPSHQALATADALPDEPRGYISIVTRAGNYRVYVGTETKLYQVASDGAVTEIGSGYSLPSGDDWSFAHHGDYLYATNTFDGMVRYNVETGGAVSAVSGAPAARFIFPLFLTLCALDCDGNNRVLRTSAINDGATWTGDASNRYQEFVDGEELIAGGEIGPGLAVVFQRNNIRPLFRTRDRSIFTTNPSTTGSGIGQGIGAQGASGCVFTRGWAYFVDTDGFHRTDGTVTEAIGKDKVSQTFIDSLAANALTTTKGAFDPSNGRILWSFRKSTTVSSTIYEDLLAYSIQLGEWVPIAMQTSAIVNIASPGYGLDQLDQFGTMETLPYPLDSRVWKGGEPKLGAFNGDFKFGFVDGDNLACTLETGSLVSGKWGRFTGITPDTDHATATIQCGVKRKISDAFTWGTAVSIDDDGFAPVDEGGMVHAYRFNAAAGDTWTFMRGFDNEQASWGGPR